MTSSIRRTALAALVFATAAGAATAGSRYSSTTTAAVQSHHRLHVIHKNLERDGFALQGMQEQPIYYFVQPEGDHAWGSIVYTYTRSGGSYSLQVDYVEVTVDLRACPEGYYVSAIRTYEHTVY